MYKKTINKNKDEKDILDNVREENSNNNNINGNNRKRNATTTKTNMDLIEKIERTAKKYENILKGKKRKEFNAFASNKYTQYNAVDIPLDELENVVFIDNNFLKYIRDISDNSSHVNSILNFLLAYISGPGVSICLEGLYHKTDLDKVMPNLIKYELIPFIEEFVREQLLWGFCVVVPVDSEHQMGVKVPKVARINSWRVCFGYKENKKYWKVYKTNVSYNIKSRDLSGDVYKEARVYELFSVRDDGQLRSPINSVKHEIYNLSVLWENSMRASSSLANPELLVETNPYDPKTHRRNNETLIDPADNYYAEHQFEPDPYRYRFESDQANKERFSIVSEEIRINNEKSQNYACYDRGSTSYYDENKYEKQEMRRRLNGWKNTIVFPEGQKVTTSPSPSILNITDDLMKNLLSSICNSFGISSSIFIRGTKMYSSNVEMELLNMNSSIQNMQHKISILLDKIMEDIWEDLLLNIKSTTFDRVFMKEIGEDESKQILDTSDLKAIYMIQQILTITINSSIRISIGFNRIPYTTVDKIKELYETKVINHDTFCHYMAKLTGIRSGDIASKKEREELMEKENVYQDDDKIKQKEDRRIIKNSKLFSINNKEDKNSGNAGNIENYKNQDNESKNSVDNESMDASSKIEKKHDNQLKKTTKVS